MVPNTLRTALVAVALASLLALSSVGAGAAAITAQPATVEQSAQSTDAANASGDEVIESFTDRMTSLETVAMTTEMNVTFDDRTTTTEQRIWIDYENDRIRTETDSDGTETITVRNESETVTYDAENNRVSRIDNADDTGPQTSIDRLVTDSELTYEGTESLDGETTYRLDVSPAEPDGEATADSADVTLWLDTETHFPVEMASDAGGDEYDYEMTVDVRNVSLNEPISDDRFTIDVPDDAETAGTSSFDRTTYDSQSDLRDDTNETVPAPAVPDGYSFVEGAVIETDTYSTITLRYATDDDETLHVTKRQHTEHSYDYSQTDRYEEVAVGDHTGYYAEFEYDGTTTSVLSMDCENATYGVSGDLSKEESIDVAESLTCE